MLVGSITVENVFQESDLIVSKPIIVIRAQLFQNCSSISTDD
jgi:hypothetical protein